MNKLIIRSKLTVLRAFLRCLVRCFKPIIDIFEKSKIKRFENEDPLYSPIFIVGAPRTGSTVLYQIITNYFDVLYINNLIDIFFGNIYFGFWLNSKFLKNTMHNNFSSDHGTTLQGGLNAPSECGPFWYRWLPSNQHYVDPDKISDDAIKEIRDNICAIINKFKKPLVIKNLNIGQRLQLIAKATPSAKFIFIKRNRLDTAKSLLQARIKVYGNVNQWWLTMPKNYEELKDLSPQQQVVKQIYYTEKQIHENSRLFPKENFLVVHYEELCSNQKDVINRVHKFINQNLAIRSSAQLSDLKVRTKPNEFENNDIEELQSEINKLDWENYTN